MSGNFEQKFFSVIDAIRSKPKATRQTYALGIAAGTTGTVVLVWLAAVVFAGYYPGLMSGQGTSLQAVESTPADRFSQFKNEFAQQVKESPERERVKQLLSQIEQEQAAAAAAAANGFGAASTTATSTTSIETQTATTSYGTTY